VVAIESNIRAPSQNPVKYIMTSLLYNKHLTPHTKYHTTNIHKEGNLKDCGNYTYSGSHLLKKPEAILIKTVNIYALPDTLYNTSSVTRFFQIFLRRMGKPNPCREVQCDNYVKVPTTSKDDERHRWSPDSSTIVTAG